MPAGVESIEIGDAVHSQDDSLAIDHKLLDAVLQGGLDYPRIALRPDITVARDQSHPIAVRSTRRRKPSCLISWSHSGPAGTLVALVGRQNSNDLGMPHNQAHSADLANPA